MPPRPNFFNLSIREQFAYVQPVIKAILDDRYPPAKDRHDSFIKGGVLRRTVRKEAPGKGNLTTKEVTELGLVLNRWALRDERYAKSARTESSAAPVHAVEPVSRGEVPTHVRLEMNASMCSRLTLNIHAVNGCLEPALLPFAVCPFGPDRCEHRFLNPGFGLTSNFEAHDFPFIASYTAPFYRGVPFETGA